MTLQQHHAPGADSPAFPCFAPQQKSSIRSWVSPNCGTWGTFAAINILTTGLTTLAPFSYTLWPPSVETQANRLEGSTTHAYSRAELQHLACKRQQLLLAGFCFQSAM